MAVVEPNCDLTLTHFPTSVNTTDDVISYFFTRSTTIPTNSKDQFYIFDRLQGIPIKSGSLTDFIDQNVVIAGSAAIKLMAETFHLEHKMNWKVSDTDVFVLNSPKDGLVKVSGIDLIAHRAKNVLELLDYFDLPCCRVACTPQYLYFTEQAFLSLMNKICGLPTLINDQERFCAQLTNVPTEESRENMFQRTQARIRKYSSRGIIFNYYDSTTIPTFLAKRWYFSRYQESATSSDVSLVLNLERNPISEQKLLQYLCYLAVSDQPLIFELQFPSELREKLIRFLSQEQTKRNQIQELKQKIKETRSFENEQNAVAVAQFREELLEQVARLEQLQIIVAPDSKRLEND